MAVLSDSSLITYTACPRKAGHIIYLSSAKKKKEYFHE